MMLLIIMSMIILIISMLLMSIASLLSKKTFLDREKNSSYECGFDPKSNFRMPFSLHFFLIAIIFLIFDIEITLFFPLILSMKISFMNNYTIIIISLILILLLGIYHEWNQGCLNWMF
uniref:NADH-ubiquinone oxidoreductase chain 3 n=1 Tax=Coleoptera sp. ACP-2013 TaxID=2485033 RepID=A0A3G3MER1_9COLE|nr:NADH dehydrogenase subunit 3 [Coleoptera sp. ACP-2013]